MSQRVLSGMRAWLYQRLTALYMVFFVPFLGWNLLISPAADFAQWQAFMANPMVAVAFAGFVLTLLLHAWVGGRDIILDYLPILWMRLTKLSLLALFLVACGSWATLIIFQVTSL